MDPPPLPFQLQEPERLRHELASAGLNDITVETIIETTEFRSGKALWEWVICSNPIAEDILGALGLTAKDREIVQQVLDKLVRERADSNGRTLLSNPINIGIGTK